MEEVYEEETDVVEEEEDHQGRGRWRKGRGELEYQDKENNMEDDKDQAGGLV